MVHLRSTHRWTVLASALLVALLVPPGTGATAGPPHTIVGNGRMPSVTLPPDTTITLAAAEVPPGSGVAHVGGLGPGGGVTTLTCVVVGTSFFGGHVMWASGSSAAGPPIFIEVHDLAGGDVGRIETTSPGSGPCGADWNHNQLAPLATLAEFIILP